MKTYTCTYYRQLKKLKISRHVYCIILCHIYCIYIIYYISLFTIHIHLCFLLVKAHNMVIDTVSCYQIGILVYHSNVNVTNTHTPTM